MQTLPQNSMISKYTARWEKRIAQHLRQLFSYCGSVKTGINGVLILVHILRISRLQIHNKN